MVWLFGLVIVCYGTSRDRLLDHVTFFMVIFYGYMLRDMDFTCMSTFSLRPFLFGLHSFEWLMLQSTMPHALLPSLLRGLLGLPLFLTSAFYFHSSNKPFYLKYSLHLKVFYLTRVITHTWIWDPLLDHWICWSLWFES